MVDLRVVMLVSAAVFCVTMVLILTRWLLNRRKSRSVGGTRVRSHIPGTQKFGRDRGTRSSGSSCGGAYPIIMSCGGSSSNDSGGSDSGSGSDSGGGGCASSSCGSSCGGGGGGCGD